MDLLGQKPAKAAASNLEDSYPSESEDAGLLSQRRPNVIQPERLPANKAQLFDDKTVARLSRCGNSQNQKVQHKFGSLDGSGGKTIKSDGDKKSSSMVGYYEVKNSIGRGNFSTVKLAKHSLTNQFVAIKVVRIHDMSQENLMKAYREVDVLKKLGRHDHLVRLYQVIKTRRYCMMVTEYCSNGDLYGYLVAKGRLGELESCDLFLQILSAIEYLHSNNIVHRDLKAENLLLTNGHKTIKIADFGFANFYWKERFLTTWCGSPPYAAPELFKGLKYVGPPVDIWSLGVILYVMVSGSLPFDGQTLVHLKERVLSGRFRIPFFMSSECESLLHKVLRVEPSKRIGIQQIKSHVWIEAYGRHVAHEASSPVGKPTVISKFNETEFKIKSTQVSAKPGEFLKPKLSSNSSNNNRGQSLDLDGDKKQSRTEDPTASSAIEDTSMLCLTSSKATNVDLPDKIGIRSATTKMQNFVNTDIANAVSNMSIESNSSSVSMSIHGNDNSNAMSTRSIGRSQNTLRTGVLKQADIDSSSLYTLNKQNSVDDEIIEFMVNHLRVTKDCDSIRRSIANNNYDDFHAIYGLLRDQPDILSNPETTFKVPSLPLLSKDSKRRPSITAGHFDLTTVDGLLKGPPPSAKSDHTQAIDSQFIRATTDGKTFAAAPRCKNELSPLELTSKDDKGIPSKLQDLVSQIQRADLGPQRRSSQTEEHNKPLPSHKHRKSADQTWHRLPQLCLTPPIEAGSTSKFSDCHLRTVSGDFADGQMKTDQSSIALQELKPQAARRSFDSTVNQMIEQQSNARLHLDRLSLSVDPRNTTWDASMFNSLEASSSVLSAETVVFMNQNYNRLGSDNMSICNVPHSGTDPMAQIATNLLQIGQLQLTSGPNQDQNILLAHLQATLVPNNVNFTQSGILPQMITSSQNYMVHEQPSMRCQAMQPNEFAQNNLLNQRLAKASPLFPIVKPPTGRVNLLDPNGCQSTGLVRRASDGLTSYFSDAKIDSESALYHQQQVHQSLLSPAPTFVDSFRLTQNFTDSFDNSCHNSSASQLSSGCLPPPSVNSPCLSHRTGSTSSRGDGSVGISEVGINQDSQLQNCPLDLSTGLRDLRGCEASSSISAWRAEFDTDSRKEEIQSDDDYNSNLQGNLLMGSPITPARKATPSVGAFPVHRVMASPIHSTQKDLVCSPNHDKRNSLDTDYLRHYCSHLSRLGVSELKRLENFTARCRNVCDFDRRLMAGKHRNSLKYPATTHLGQMRQLSKKLSCKIIGKQSVDSNPQRHENTPMRGISASTPGTNK